MHLGDTTSRASFLITIKTCRSWCIWLFQRHFLFQSINVTPTVDTLHPCRPLQSWQLLHITAPVRLSLCFSIPFYLGPSFVNSQSKQSQPRMASANQPGLPHPPGVTPNLNSPYTLQPYQTLTVVACIIMTTVMVAARLYTVRNFSGPVFSIPSYDRSRKTNSGLGIPAIVSQFRD